MTKVETTHTDPNISLASGAGIEVFGTISSNSY